MNFNRNQKIALLLFSIFLLTGCVTTDMDREERHELVDTRNTTVKVGQAGDAVGIDIAEQVKIHRNRIQKAEDRDAAAKKNELEKLYVRERFGEYEHPNTPKLDILYAGFGSFLNQNDKPIDKNELERRLIASLSSESSQEEFEAIVSDYFRRVSMRKPELGLRVPYATGGKLLGDSWEKTAIASVAMSDAVIVNSVFESGSNDRILYVSMPLFLVSAKNYELLYSRPLFMRIKLVEGVEVDNPEVADLVAIEVGRYLEKCAGDQEIVDAVAGSLARGAYRNPNAPIYAIRGDDVRFSDAASTLGSGFSDLDGVRALLRSAASHYLADNKRVFPPIPAEYSRSLFEELGSEFYGLSVVTDNQLTGQLPKTDSGLTVLPIKRVGEDYRLSLFIKSGVQRDESGSSGICQVILDYEELLENGNAISSNSTDRAANFISNPSQISLAGEDCLIEALIHCAKTFESGL